MVLLVRISAISRFPADTGRLSVIELIVARCVALGCQAHLGRDAVEAACQRPASARSHPGNEQRAVVAEIASVCCCRDSSLDTSAIYRIALFLFCCLMAWMVSAQGNTEDRTQEHDLT
ncbi:unnamed protein product [Boreogadus saida]